jgi:hypothetical protein
MRVAGYFHEIDDWCPAEAYPLHIERLNHAEAEERLKDGFCCSGRFEGRANIFGLAPSWIERPRAIDTSDELLLLHDWQGARASAGRAWWLVTRYST